MDYFQEVVSTLLAKLGSHERIWIRNFLCSLAKSMEKQTILLDCNNRAFQFAIIHELGYSWPPKYKSVHWLVFEWQWFHNQYGKNYPITETDIHHTWKRSKLCLFVENIEPCASCSALFQVNSFYNCYKMLVYDIFIDENLRPHLIKGILSCISWCGTNFDEDEFARIFFWWSVLLQLLYFVALAKFCVVEDVNGFLMIPFVCNV